MTGDTQHTTSDEYLANAFFLRGRRAQNAITRLIWADSCLFFVKFEIVVQPAVQSKAKQKQKYPHSTSLMHARCPNIHQQKRIYRSRLLSPPHHVMPLPYESTYSLRRLSFGFFVPLLALLSLRLYFSAHFYDNNKPETVVYTKTWFNDCRGIT